MDPDTSSHHQPQGPRPRYGRRAVIWGIVTAVSLLLCGVLFVGPLAVVIASLAGGVQDVALDQPSVFERDDYAGGALLMRRQTVAMDPAAIRAAVPVTDAAGVPLPMRASEITTITIMNESYQSVAAIELDAVPAGGVFFVDATALGDQLQTGDLVISPDLFGGGGVAMFVGGICGSCVVFLMLIAGLVMTIISLVQYMGAPKA